MTLSLTGAGPTGGAAGGGAGTTFVNDAFTDTAGTTLASHTPDAGGSWVKHTNSAAQTGTISTSTPNRLILGGSDVMYYVSATPATADYDVLGTITAINNTTGHFITGRHATAANTFYGLRLNGSSSLVELFKRVAGTFTSLNTAAFTVTIGQAFVLKLQMRGTTITGFVDGVQQVTASDSAIAAAGQAGLRAGQGDIEGSQGQYIDNFQAVNA